MVIVARWVLIVGLVMLCSSAAGLVAGHWRQPDALVWGALDTPALPAPPISSHNFRRRTDGGVSDLYGNRISQAVATYGIDAFGGAVEQHFPDLRISKLGPPEG